MPGSRVVVVGNGMVGHRFCDELASRNRENQFAIVCLGEEPRAAYDRVRLSDFFGGKSAGELQLAEEAWYAERDIDLRLGERVVEVDRAEQRVRTASDAVVEYDVLVLATGSAPFVPPIPGRDLPGVFVYRTIEDVEAIRAWGARCSAAAVIGGGLLGLEAAKAVRDMGLETHVVEFAPRLMPRQVDAAGGEILKQSIERLGVHVHLAAQTEAIEGEGAVSALRIQGREPLAVQMVIISAGIRPRDELARTAGLAVGERGGIVVDTALATSDPRVFCIGESALASGMIYGLVAPGYEMARTLAARLCGEDARFTGADLSTKLKLLGVEVASFGDPFADEALGTGCHRIVVEDRGRGVYQKLVASANRRLLGGILVGDASAYDTDLLNVTGFGFVPTYGGFEIDANRELDITVGGIALNLKESPALGAMIGRLFWYYYGDFRVLVFLDNRPLPERQADRGKAANLHTVGGSVARVEPLGIGALDGVAYGFGQFGDWQSQVQRAWAYGAEIGYRLLDVWAKPWLRGGIDAASGDTNPNDGQHGTFFQMLPTAWLYAQFPFYNMMNNQDVFLQSVLDPHPLVSLRLDLHWLRLSSSRDLAYFGAARPATSFSATEP